MGVIDLDSRVKALEANSGRTSEAMEQLDAKVDTLEDAVETLATFSTTKRKVGTWIDGKDIYEKTYVFQSSDMNQATISASVQKGKFWLDVPYEYSTVWIDYGNSFVFNTNKTTSAVKSHPLNLSGADGVYTRTNLQRTSGSHDGLPFVYYENTYSASSWYDIITDFRWIITVKWTEEETEETVTT